MRINKTDNVGFGINRVPTRVRETSPVSSKTLDIIKLNNGKTIHISTNYMFNKVTDRLFTVFNSIGEVVKSVLKVHTRDGKVHKL